jgi:hypothetical protein
MSSKKGTKRSIIEIEHPIQGKTIGQRSASKADTTSPASKKQDRASSSESREVPTRGMEAAATAVADLVALARVTDTAAHEDSNAPPATSGIVSDRAAAGFMTSTGVNPVGHDRSEISTEDAVLGRSAAGHSTSTGARPDSHDQPRNNEYSRR